MEHFLYIGFICLVNRGRIRKVTFPLGGLFSQDVAFVRMFALDFACTSKLKSLFGS